jgi:hypothetical protein
MELEVDAMHDYFADLIEAVIHSAGHTMIESLQQSTFFQQLLRPQRIALVTCTLAHHPDNVPQKPQEDEMKGGADFGGLVT